MITSYIPNKPSFLMELFQNISLFFPWNPYSTHAIISHGLYIFYPISKDHFFVFQQFFSENSVIMYGLYLRAVSNQEQLMMACVRYLEMRLT